MWPQKKQLDKSERKAYTESPQCVLVLGLVIFEKYIRYSQFTRLQFVSTYAHAILYIHVHVT